MWSVWLVFCDCGFHSVPSLTDKDKRLMEASWWEKLTIGPCWFSSVQFSCSVVSDSLWPHELQYTRPPCPSPTPGVHPNSCPLSRYAIQPSHPLSSPSPPAPNPSQHQSLFQWVITSWQIDGETVAGFIFLGSKITADGDCRHEIKRRLLLGREVWPT